MAGVMKFGIGAGAEYCCAGICCEVAANEELTAWKSCIVETSEAPDDDGATFREWAWVAEGGSWAGEPNELFHCLSSCQLQKAGCWSTVDRKTYSKMRAGFHEGWLLGMARFCCMSGP